MCWSVLKLVAQICFVRHRGAAGFDGRVVDGWAVDEAQEPGQEFGHWRWRGLATCLSAPIKGAPPGRG
jgi:hypothetical protein